MTENEVRQQLTEIFGSTLNLKVPLLAEQLTTHSVPLKGYLLWLLQKVGPAKLLQSIMKMVPKYAVAVKVEKRALPQHIVNCGTLFSELAENSTENDRVLELLESMVPAYAIYFLFAGIGYPVGKYRKAAKEYAEVYLDAVLSLPEPYKELGKALTHDST